MSDNNHPAEQQSELEALLIQAITEGFVEVPILSEVANKAFILANDKCSDAGQMAQLIQSDPSLAGHIMRIANSAAYTPVTNLISLQQAIAWLGMTTISEIAMTAVLRVKLFNTPGFETYVDANSRQALATSLWAKEIARHCQVNAEAAFLAGLIHSIGRPAILQTLIDLCSQRDLPLDHVILHQLEDKYWLKVSQMVVIRWSMPVLVIDAIQHLEDPNAGKMAAVVDVSKHFAGAMLADKLTEDVDFGLSKAITILNLSPQEVKMLTTRQEQINERLEKLIA